MKTEPYVTAVLIVFVLLVVIRAVEPTTDAKDLFSIGGTVITGLFALMTTRKTGDTSQ